MLFFSMTRLTPSSPLFPYTTLFRSLQVRLPPGHHAARDAHRLARRAQGAGRDALRGAGAVRGRPGPLRLGHEEAARRAGAQAVGAVRLHHRRPVRRAARDLHAAERYGMGSGRVSRHDLRGSPDVSAVKSGGPGWRAAADVRGLGAESAVRGGGGVVVAEGPDIGGNDEGGSSSLPPSVT